MSLIFKKENEKHEIAEQVPHHAPTPDIVMDDTEVNTSNTEVQTQTVMECPMEEGSQANTEAPNMEVNTVTQQDSSGVSSLPKLRDELDTLSPTGNATVQSNGHSDPHLSEHIVEPTKADKTRRLQSEGFIPVVSKKLAASRKSILIDKSMSQD
ncbi:40479_t:CDS:2 [Gigaspora margarita]|uniref:40479_t:CDS:1 n=1 Tax=Gigaspora margarita TaxID=4874 RepID=A0ABN7WKW0_GIGMA|nr:40479_t:CDS:2 [Gigaspora margarita]